jgi:hypothetical protein
MEDMLAERHDFDFLVVFQRVEAYGAIRVLVEKALVRTFFDSHLFKTVRDKTLDRTLLALNSGGIEIFWLFL